MKTRLASSTTQQFVKDDFSDIKFNFKSQCHRALEEMATIARKLPNSDITEILHMTISAILFKPY